MATKLNKWLDNFVANGADPTDIDNWSSVSVYDVDITSLIDGLTGDIEIELHLDDTRIDVPALVQAIEQKKLIRMKAVREDDSAPFKTELLVNASMLTKGSDKETSEPVVYMVGAFFETGSIVIDIYVKDIVIPEESGNYTT